MNLNRCLAISTFKESDCLTNTKNNSSLHPLFIMIMSLVLIFTAHKVHAEQLWNNGNTDGSNSLSWGQYSSTLDDFYVPGGGWWMDSAQTSGFFLNNGDTVTKIEATIWPHDMDSDEPDGDNAFPLKVLSFEALPTGNQYFGYDEIMVNVVFENTYLDGQRYYWIEFKVENQNSVANFHFLARQDNLHNPARIRIGNSGGDTYANDNGMDLAYKLFGNKVKLLVIGNPDSLKLGTITKGKASHMLQIKTASPNRQSRFGSGLYQMKLVNNRPQLFYFDETGRTKLNFKTVPSRNPQMFHTPLGDDMCKNAPALIQNYCQTFVACAAYDLSC